MIDNYAIAAIIIRSITFGGLCYVLGKQIQIIRNKDELQWVKWSLLVLLSVMMFNAAFSTALNFHRAVDGNLTQAARHLSLIVNSLSGLCSAIALGVLYYRNDKD